MKTSILLAGGLAILGASALLFVAEADTRPKATATAVAKDALPDEEPFGKTIRLEFTITNDDGKHTLPVVCAARSFHKERDVVEADGGHQLKIAGYMKKVDAKDRVFVYFDLLRYHSNDVEGANATFKLKGSAIVKFGKKTEIGSLGEEKITLTASVVE